MFLLRKATADALNSGVSAQPVTAPALGSKPDTEPESEPERVSEPALGVETQTIRIVGTVPPEIWNRLGTKILPKLRSGSDLKVGVDFSVTVNATSAGNLAWGLRQILREFGLADAVRVE